jgi:uncharacterized protein with PQ loop repeat
MIVNIRLFKYLRSKKNKKVVDKLMESAAVLHPLTALPQVIAIYSTHQAADLSVAMWIGFLILGLIFMAYGIAHNLKPYILMQTLWLTIDLAMIIGIIKYS